MQPLQLLLLSKSMYEAAERAVFGEIDLEDDDGVLVSAEVGEGLLGRIWTDERIASKVERLRVGERKSVDVQVSLSGLEPPSHSVGCASVWRGLRTVEPYPALPRTTPHQLDRPPALSDSPSFGLLNFRSDFFSDTC